MNTKILLLLPYESITMVGLNNTIENSSIEMSGYSTVLIHFMDISASIAATGPDPTELSAIIALYQSSLYVNGCSLQETCLL